ncbi:hypothetical protein N657DRAFT_676104 [Parathielavia appendiculata]|uniref:YTH domain-containing protein n=1 Tax=Parathielavia appendiculata TaxID=2587402 RepID=A0AAN6U8Q3_9PEZI|nr:hypothetical protein N657DRAFT_676104 [Parathielavia appendiculata]
MTHRQRTAAFDMSALANTLPQGLYRPLNGHGQQRYNTFAPPVAGNQLGVSSTVGPMPTQEYYLAQQTHMAHFYQTPMSSQAPPAMTSRADQGYYPSPVLMNQAAHGGVHFYYSPTAAFQGHSPHVHGHVALGQYGLIPTVHQHADPRSPQSMPSGQEVLRVPPSAGPQVKGGINGRRSIVRGPPRKPRQSGHAIWIGNLPPQTDLMSLVHHVCKETEGLESLFLISKSNCAFANYKDEQLCSAAQRKLHDSNFMAVRLVSRLRKSTVEGPAGVTAPTGPSASAPQAPSSQDDSVSGVEGGETREENGASVSYGTAAAHEAKAAASLMDARPVQRDRFFVLKSLTIEDLELSVRTGIWATQAHNEDILNSAFQTSDNVYLVFSANKSGEYFGYARMASPINSDPAAAIEFAPSVQSASEVELPKAIPTEATEFAPKGRIIDDSARGTIFWEADRDDDNDDNNNKAAAAATSCDGGQQQHDDEGVSGSTSGSAAGGVGADTGSVRSGQDGSSSVSVGAAAGREPNSKAWGKPFRLEWLSTSRLPFYRTRGLRNPWNSNREVKIARDGTELEPSVGRRLIGLFNRVPQSPALPMLPPMVAPMGSAVVQLQGPPTPATMAGYYAVR